MRKRKQRFLATVAVATAGRAGESDRCPSVIGVAGRLRPYRDVRASFEPWRRVALLAWALRDEAATVH